MTWCQVQQNLLAFPTNFHEIIQIISYLLYALKVLLPTHFNVA